MTDNERMRRLAYTVGSVCWLHVEAVECMTAHLKGALLRAYHRGYIPENGATLETLVRLSDKEVLQIPGIGKALLSEVQYLRELLLPALSEEAP